MVFAWTLGPDKMKLRIEKVGHPRGKSAMHLTYRYATSHTLVAMLLLRLRTHNSQICALSSQSSTCTSTLYTYTCLKYEHPVSGFVWSSKSQSLFSTHISNQKAIDFFFNLGDGFKCAGPNSIVWIVVPREPQRWDHHVLRRGMDFQVISKANQPYGVGIRLRSFFSPTCGHSYSYYLCC